MGKFENISHLQKDYQDIYVQMRGISPKLSLYGELAQKLEDIKKQIGENNLPRVAHLLASKSGRPVRNVNRVKGTDHLIPKLTECNISGCTNKRASCQTKCGDHMREKRQRRAERRKKPVRIFSTPPITICKVEGCEASRIKGKRFCESHYQLRVESYNQKSQVSLC